MRRTSPSPAQGLGQYYPNGADWNNGPTGVIQPTSPATQNLNTFAVASMVTAITSSSGSTIYTDPYSQGNKLYLYNGAKYGTSGDYSPGASAAIIAGSFVPNTNGSTGVSLQWRTRSQGEMSSGAGQSNNLPGGADYLASNVLQMSGQAPGNDYVLQMSFDNEIETPGDQVATSPTTPFTWGLCIM